MLEPGGDVEFQPTFVFGGVSLGKSMSSWLLPVPLGCSESGRTNVGGAVRCCDDVVVDSSTFAAAAAAGDCVTKAGAVGECDFMSHGEWELGVRGGDADSFIA